MVGVEAKARLVGGDAQRLERPHAREAGARPVRSAATVASSSRNHQIDTERLPQRRTRWVRGQPRRAASASRTANCPVTSSGSTRSMKRIESRNEIRRRRLARFRHVPTPPCRRRPG